MDTVIVVAGLSGSGKSLALDVFEDHGYCCVDNIPVSLVPDLMDTVDRESRYSRLAFGADLHFAILVVQFLELWQGLRARYNAKMIFMESSNETLIQRYSETRRVHPLAHHTDLPTAIAQEREILDPLRSIADDIVDTSHLNPQDFRTLVASRFVGMSADTRLQIQLVSFGYKYGLPLDADIIFDVRFLPNPYFEPSLKQLTGHDDAVYRRVTTASGFSEYMKRLLHFLEFSFAAFGQQGRRRITVAVGCTGGQHRSVSVVRALHEHLRAGEVAVDVRHRECAASSS